LRQIDHPPKLIAAWANVRTVEIDQLARREVQLEHLLRPAIDLRPRLRNDRREPRVSKDPSSHLACLRLPIASEPPAGATAPLRLWLVELR